MKTKLFTFVAALVASLFTSACAHREECRHHYGVRGPNGASCESFYIHVPLQNIYSEADVHEVCDNAKAEAVQNHWSPAQVVDRIHEELPQLNVEVTSTGTTFVGRQVVSDGAPSGCSGTVPVSSGCSGGPRIGFGIGVRVGGCPPFWGMNRPPGACPESAFGGYRSGVPYRVSPSGNIEYLGTPEGLAAHGPVYRTVRGFPQQY